MQSLELQPHGNLPEPYEFLRQYWTTFDVLWAVEAALVVASVYNRSGSSDSPVAPVEPFQFSPDPCVEVLAIRAELLNRIFSESSSDRNWDSLTSLSITLLGWHDQLSDLGQGPACCMQSSSIVSSMGAIILRRDALHDGLNQFQTLLINRKSNLAGELSRTFQGYVSNWEEACKNDDIEPRTYPHNPPAGSLYVLNCPKSHVYSYENLCSLLKDRNSAHHRVRIGRWPSLPQLSLSLVGLDAR